MATPENVIASLDLEKFFGENEHKYDLHNGTVYNPGGTRVVFLSSDVIKGVHTALEYEAGEAWRIILKNCGYLWGKRVAKNLDRELQLLFKSKQGELTVNDYIGFVESYFAQHGWGIVKIDLDLAISKGVVKATFKNSIFRSVLSDIDGFVDQMIEGMLRSLLEFVSGQDLECVQVSDAEGADGEAEFAISSLERIEAVREMVEENASRDAVYEKLLG